MGIAINFLILYFANLVLDYPLQGQFLAEWKSKSDYILFVHCAIWGVGMWLACCVLGLGDWWKLPMLLGGHYAMDWWKCRRKYEKYGIGDMQSLYIDQAFHALQTLLCLV